MAKSELLPCPFCGGVARMVVLTSYPPKYQVEHSCEVVCAKPAETPEQAIAAWNTRAETKAERDLQDEVNWLNAELHGAEMAASGETVLLDEQYSHAMRLVEELHQVLSLNGGGYLDEFGSQVDGGAGAVS